MVYVSRQQSKSDCSEQILRTRVNNSVSDAYKESDGDITNCDDTQIFCKERHFLKANDSVVDFDNPNKLKEEIVTINEVGKAAQRVLYDAERINAESISSKNIIKIKKANTKPYTYTVEF